RDNANNPVNHAAVGLFKDNDIHTAGYTNPSGYIIFDITPSTAGNMDITVTDHNHFPFEGTISVTDNGATITVSPDYGPPNISLTIAGSNFSVGETVNIDFGGTLLIPSPSTGTNDSFSQSFNAPTVPEGPINVIATGQTSGRVAVAAFRMMPAQPLPDPFTYSQWDSSTWYLDPSGGKVWNSPCIELREQNTGNTVSSNNLRVGTTYTIRATIYNATAVAANGTNVTFKYAEWAAGQKVWNIIDTDTVNLFPAMLVPSSAVASALWTPITTGHCCIVVEIDHPWDTNLKNNKGQENTDVHPITSPAEITFDVFNPTDARALVYLEVTQNDPCEPGELWGTRIQREYPQILEPGERQTATLEVLAPDNVETGESRTITVTGTIEGETIGGVEIQVIKDNPPVLTDGYVDPNSGIAGADFTYWVTYADEDNHSPMNGYPALSIFKAGEPIAGSPFAMEAEDPNDSDYSDGKTYVCSISLSESGKDYTHSFWARDSLGIGAEGPAITMVPGPLVEPILGDLVAHYAFENDTTDSSGNGLDGTVIGDPEFVDGAEGMALDFNGDHYVDCGGNAEFSFTDAMTVSTWVNIRSVTTAWMAMIAKGENAWRLGVNNQTTGIHYAFTGSARDWQAANTATELPFDEWYHVAATYDTNVGALVYINGVLDASNPDIGGIVTNEMPLLLGDNPEATGRFFDGMLDEVKIYNRALSAEEIGYLAGLR
ncbi:MAG: LamG domain-containing protein, partial [Planctomycetota bacterium]